MEWSKAKSILIFLFIFLNIFLFISILQIDSHTRPGLDYIRHVNSLLQTRNIRIDCSVPVYQANSGSIVYKEKAIDESQVAAFFLGHGVEETQEQEKMWEEDEKVLEIGNNKIIFTDSSPAGEMDISDRKAVATEVKSILEALGIKPNDYVPDVWREVDGKLHVRYVKTYKRQPLFDIYADFLFSSEGLMHAEIIPGEISHVIAENEILTAWQLLAVADLSENSVISDVTFGYKRIHEGELYDSPVWRIRFSDGSELFYNAYTGEKIG